MSLREVLRQAAEPLPLDGLLEKSSRSCLRNRRQALALACFWQRWVCARGKKRCKDACPSWQSIHDTQLHSLPFQAPLEQIAQNAFPQIGSFSRSPISKAKTSKGSFSSLLPQTAQKLCRLTCVCVANPWRVVREEKARTRRKKNGREARRFCGGFRLAYAASWADFSNAKVSSSATRKIGLPPVEIDSAWASVACAPSDAAQVFNASIDGKWISTMR